MNIENVLRECEYERVYMYNSEVYDLPEVDS